MLFSTGQSCNQGAAAQRAEGVHQQGALQRGLRRVRHRPLGLAWGLARALQPPHGDAGQRGCQRSARGHEGAHRCVRLWLTQPCCGKLLKLCLVASVVSRSIQIEEIGIFFLSSPWCLLLAVGSCAQQVSWELGKEVLCCRLKLSRGLIVTPLFFPDTCSF